MGRGYSLEVRNKDAIKFEPLGYVFWTTSDGDYNSYKDDPFAVENKLWYDEKEILKKATEILKALKYI